MNLRIFIIVTIKLGHDQHRYWASQKQEKNYPQKTFEARKAKLSHFH